jgi:hypothetical protein
MRIASEIPETYPLVHRWLIPPGIRLEGSALRHDAYPREPKKWNWAERPTARLLWDFAELAEAVDKDIRGYAQRWGVLALCRHGIPNEILYSFHFEKGRQECPAIGSEPLQRWREYATMFKKMLANIDQVRAGRVNADNAAFDISRFAVAFGHLRPVLVRTEVNDLALRLAGSRLGGGLSAALGYQLLVLMAGGNGMLICAECGQWFESASRRDPDRNVYCDKCGRAAAMRAASRRYYEKHKNLKGKNNGQKA